MTRPAHPIRTVRVRVTYDLEVYVSLSGRLRTLSIEEWIHGRMRTVWRPYFGWPLSLPYRVAVHQAKEQISASVPEHPRMLEA
jgi:hypothetical protein